MITIDEAIVHEREGADIARGNIIKSNNLDGYESWHNSQCIKCAEEHEQLAEWLEELKCYRNDNDFSEYADRLHKIAFNSGYNKAIDDFLEKINYTAYTPVCVDCMTKNQIIEIAEQLKAGETE